MRRNFLKFPEIIKQIIQFVYNVKKRLLEKELSEEKTDDEEQNIQNSPGEDSDKEEKDEENILKESS